MRQQLPGPGQPSRRRARPPSGRSIEFGYGMASVRFICGTQTVCTSSSRQRLGRFLGTEDAILYSSCFDANGGPVRDAARRARRGHLRRAQPRLASSMASACARRSATATPTATWQNSSSCLKDSRGRAHAPDRHRRRVLDGRHDREACAGSAISPSATTPWSWWMTPTPPASWAPPGAARPSTAAWPSRIDILTGTLGKALGGGSGGYIAARREVIEWLRQRSRPYLFSNSIPPVVAAASIAVLDLLESSPRCARSCSRTRASSARGSAAAGFDLSPASTRSSR